MDHIGAVRTGGYRFFLRRSRRTNDDAETFLKEKMTGLTLFVKVREKEWAKTVYWKNIQYMIS